MDLVEFLHQAVHHLMPAVPWLIGGACVAMVSLGPVGRAFSSRLREGNVSARRANTLLDEVMELRSDVGELVARLDEHESALANLDMQKKPRIRQWPNSEREIQTPV